jgi:hypothetical protein
MIACALLFSVLSRAIFGFNALTNVHVDSKKNYKSNLKLFNAPVSIPNPVVNDKILRQTALMISLWESVAFPPLDDDPNLDLSISLKLSDYGLTRVDVKGVLQHFQNCKDCAGNPP